MKFKKLEKTVKFTFKKSPLKDLSIEQMRKINGGNPTDGGGGLSGDPGCANKTIAATVGD